MDIGITPPTNTAAVASRHTSGSKRAFLGFLIVLILFYGSWLLVFWPGVLGEDSLAVLLEIVKPDAASGKPAFWFYFVNALYSGLERVEIPVGVIMLFCAMLLARMLGWIWNQGLKKTAIFLLLFVCITPHIVYFIGTLYPDGVYSVAATALLFEVWLCARNRKASKISLLIIATTLPFAAFARPNGVTFLLPLAYLIYFLWKLDRKGSLFILAITIIWLLTNATANHIRKSGNHGAIYPLVIYETVNFLRPRPMNLWVATPRVSPKTVATLEKYHPINVYQSHWDPDYWDPLVFRPDGPKVMGIAKSDKRIIIKQFFKYNIWRNIPMFMGSRINILLSASFAQGGLPSHIYAKFVLPIVQSHSTYRAFDLEKLESIFFKVYDYSYKVRWLLWSPFLGFILVLLALKKGLKNHSTPLLLVSIPMVIQFGGIFLFSIAAEYRYILPFFMIPLVLLPALILFKHEAPKS